MPNSLQNLLYEPFSHIYVEKAAFSYDLTKRIINRFSKANVIEVTHYKDFFARGRQNYALQKQTPKLILAVKQNNFVYDGARVCEDFGNSYFYYTSTMMNCVYDCEYCYLQGMYPSGNIVVFVNLEDYFAEVDRLLNHHPVYLCISYDTDILAFENILGYGAGWLGCLNKKPDLYMELRTKSANFSAIRHIEPNSRMILAWTLSPDEIISRYEHKTPGLTARLASALEAVQAGWKVRLCFDPLLYVHDFEKIYGGFIKTVFETIPPDSLYDVSIGVFRVGKDYMKKMRKQRPFSPVLQYPYSTEGGVASYKGRLSAAMLDFAAKEVSKYMESGKIYV